MKLIDSIAKRFGYTKPRKSLPMQRRGYDAATVDRLTQDWLRPFTDANAELQMATRALRNGCRESERNDDYMRAYLRLLENNVLGANGIGLQMKVRKSSSGSPDEIVNDAIEAAWKIQGKKQNCCVNRAHTWRGLSRLILRSAKRDGGALLRKMRGFGNRYKYALQPIEIDHLDLDFNGSLPNGNTAQMGVEIDQWGAMVALHVWQQHPGTTRPNMRNNKRERILASDILHIFVPDRISQIIGAPAPSASLTGMKMLAGYKEAELVAAREAACKGGGIKKPIPNDYSGETDGNGNSLQNMEPGMTLELNPGEEYFEINPNHPVEAFPNFVKSVLRAISGGLGVSYNSLANDLEGVNYSSIRAGLLEEREEWKAVQQWFIEEVCEPIFEDWLEWCLGFGFIQMPHGQALNPDAFDYYNAPEWKPRRWAWVDPLKDIEAERQAIALRLKSRRNSIAEDGGDIDDVDKDFEDDPVTKDLDVKAAYVPTSNPPPSDGGGDAPPRALGVNRLLAGLHD